MDVAFCLNKEIMTGFVAAVNSVVRSSADPGALRLSVVTPPGEEALFERVLERLFPAIRWRVASFSPSPDLAGYLERRFAPRTPAHRTGRHMSYARLFLGRIFPDLGKTIYLDADVVVLRDLAQLYRAADLGPDRCFAAAPHLFPAFGYFRKPLSALSEIAAIERPFNAGVFVADLSRWDDDVLARMRRYMEWDDAHGCRLLNLGDETILNLTFKSYVRLDRCWNQSGFGNAPVVASLLRRLARDPAIIHWSGGHRKPWSSEDIPFRAIWDRYDRSAEIEAVVGVGPS